jgi:hypothetical protein
MRVAKSVEHALELPAGCDRLEVLYHEGLLTVEPGPALTCSVLIEVLASDEAAATALIAQATPMLTPVGKNATQVQVTVPPGASLDSLRTTWRVQAPASTSLVVRTRKGGVAAHGATSDLEVLGGSGVIDARMNGGSAVLSTTSGSILLNGSYPFADLRTGIGRIDIATPPQSDTPTELRVATQRGGVFLDLRPSQAFDFQFRGLTRLVECDPEVRVQWQQVREIEGVEYTVGRLGNLQTQPQGVLQMESGELVRVRLGSLPEKAADNKATATH